MEVSKAKTLLFRKSKINPSKAKVRTLKRETNQEIPKIRTNKNSKIKKELKPC
jgi:hypothetical protein